MILTQDTGTDRVKFRACRIIERGKGGTIPKRAARNEMLEILSHARTPSILRGDRHRLSRTRAAQSRNSCRSV